MNLDFDIRNFLSAYNYSSDNDKMKEYYSRIERLISSSDNSEIKRGIKRSEMISSSETQTPMTLEQKRALFNASIILGSLLIAAIFTWHRHEQRKKKIITESKSSNAKITASDFFRSEAALKKFKQSEDYKYVMMAFDFLICLFVIMILIRFINYLAKPVTDLSNKLF